MQHKVAEMLGRVGEAQSPLRPTELYNEGWMLRLVLDWCGSNRLQDHPLRFVDGARWFSEALMASQFRARSREDPLSESRSHADGVIGHVRVETDTKGGLAVMGDAGQFVVIEAKMMSGLSTRTKNAPGFDQAARNVACMAEALRQARRPPAKVDRLAFYVIAPKEQIEAGRFGKLVTRESIGRKVERRVSAYGGEKEAWMREWFVPTLDKVELGLVPWEELVVQLPGEFREFYVRCLTYNRSVAESGIARVDDADGAR